MLAQRTLLTAEMADFELAEEFLPVYDVSDAVATVVDADPETAGEALLDVDLLEGRTRRAAGRGARRAADAAGDRRPSAPRRAAGEAAGVDAAARYGRDPEYEGGWMLLGDAPGEEIALGLVGKFWRPVIEYGGGRAPTNSATSRVRVRKDGLRPVDAAAREAGHCSRG